jgi:hypothetical protein
MPDEVPAAKSGVAKPRAPYHSGVDCYRILDQDAPPRPTRFQVLEFGMQVENPLEFFVRERHHR